MYSAWATVYLIFNLNVYISYFAVFPFRHPVTYKVKTAITAGKYTLSKN